MMRWGIVVLLSVVFAGVVPAQSQEKAAGKRLPSARWARPRKIDVKHVVLDLRFDWAKRQAYGTAAITFAPLAPTRRVTLDAARLSIRSITLAGGGAPLAFAYDGGEADDSLAIELDRVHAAGEDLTVRIEYRTTWVNRIDPNSLSGSNGRGLRFSAPTANDPRKPREIWSMGEPESNRYWFPGYDAPNDLRTTEFIATVDRPLLALSNGRIVETRTNADGTRTFHWKAETPYANHLTSFVVGEYVDVPQRFEGVELHNFGYPNETAAVAASVERLPEMVAFFSDLTGVKSPFSQYSQVFVQDLPWGIGSHGLAVQSENMVDDDRTHADFLYLWDGLEAEALAHQWFGNYLTCRDWSHVWLNRGFAHYFDGLYNAHKNGREEFLLWQVLGDQATYLADWRAGVRHPIVTPHYEDAPGFVGDNYSYVRGASVLHLLRRHLGDETWRRAVRRYLQANAHRPVVTEDFRRAVEEASGEPMDWFFDQWLYRMGHPVFDVAWRHDAAKQQLILTVRQTQQIDPKEPYPQVEFFQGAVEIEIDEAIERVWLAPKAENVFTFARPRSPQLVHFDYESAWIKELRFEKPLDELLHQLKHDRDILGRRWAIDELGARAADGKTSAADRERICAGLREAILGPSYWRLRLAALSQLQSLLAPAAQPQPAVLDDATIAMLLIVIRNETSWNRAAAIGFLGMTRDPRHAELYLRHLDDPSDRVIGAAALALGRSRSPAAFAALAALVRKPSWKNQSLMSALNGLRELGDPRGFEIAFGALSDLSLFRWRLPTPPVWDLRVFATQTLAALGRADAAYPLLAGRLDKALAEDDLEGAFNNALLLVLLADPRAQADLDRLKLRFRDDENALTAVRQLESQLQDALKKKTAPR